MKTKEHIVHAMCMTQRHDYGLDKDVDCPLDGGMTQKDREFLYREMSQLYDHHIAPLVDILNKTLYHLPVGNIKEHTFESIPERVQYYVNEYSKASHELDKLVDIHKPFCKSCTTNLVYYDGWHCECEDFKNASKDWLFLAEDDKKNLVDLDMPFCRSCKTNLIHFDDATICQCKSVDAFHWVM